MSDYGPPPGPSGPPGPPGPPRGGTSSQAPAGAPTGTGTGSGAAQQITILSYAAGALGVLSFVWGFLDWFGGSVGDGLSGYSVGGGPAGAVVGLALVAGLLAAATTFEKKELGTVPAAIALAGLLVAFGVLVGHGDSADTKIGLILAFITAIVQTAALVVAWLMSTGKLASFGGGSSSQPAGQWQGPNAQHPGPQQGPGPQGPGPQQRPGPQGQFGGFAGEQGQFGPPPGYGPPPQDPAPSYGPPPGYAPPPQGPAPSYGPPPGAPSGPPSGYGPPQPPSAQPPAPPQSGPPPSNEDDTSRTQVLPRFQPDQNSTQQGIPIFDPQSRPDDRPGEDQQR